MADSVIVQKLDTRLIEEGILDRAFEKDYSLVHQKLNEEIRKTGKFAESKVNFELGEKILRDWLLGLARQGASQDKLTNYLRCGLAHLSYERIESDNEGTDVDSLILRALVSFQEQDFEKSFFRLSDQEKVVAQPVVVAPKKSAAKKAAKKKTAKKKSAKKKATPKKKKTAKKAAKKKVAKKKAPKKTAKKKTSKKKTSKKKMKKR
ncbi:hypothetical protein [Leptospira alstonii]|uniref:hypothetical protein n=1 Tax=Leptospira alstonii TaxID=28452 RepID=UPI00077374A6|nr:hypothetical protein [Leptospira alstonii]